MQRGFGSDNHSGVHPQIMDSLFKANQDHAPSYGTDEWSHKAQEVFKNHFGPEAQTFFVFNGTAANVTALRALAKPYQAVFCSDVAHLHVDECGAPEFLAGTKVIPVKSHDGKITVQELDSQFIRRGDQHYAQGQVLSLTQPTELGTVYSKAELKELITWAKQKKILVHIDGARLSNAVTFLKCSFKDITTDLGVDVVSFGGTKNGLMMGEAVVFLNKALAQDFKYIRKQSAQLPSKSRFIACQFETYLGTNLWQEISQHSLAMAQELYLLTKDIPGVEVSFTPQGNAVFAKVPAKWVKQLREKNFFYVWDESSFQCRWMTSWDTQHEDLQGFSRLLKELSENEISSSSLS